MTADNTVVRTRIESDDIKFRQKGLGGGILRKIRVRLAQLSSRETMAGNIYRFQLGKKETEHNRWLIAALGNEGCHAQDFELKLREYCAAPSLLRFGYWVVGIKIGFISRLLGKKAMLKAGIWAEKKAVEYYDRVLGEIDWPEDIRVVIERDRADELVHIQRWQKLLG